MSQQDWLAIDTDATAIGLCVFGSEARRMVATHTHEVSTTGQGDAQDLTAIVATSVASSDLTAGVATVFVVGSTAGVTTLEFESGVVNDLDSALEQLAPRDGDYRHHLRWGDDNGSSHVRAALVGPSVAIPFIDKRLMLGTWQQIVIVELDTRPRRRQIVIQLVGE
jgi:secondary thiamine-phosphate synthase enzyme